jgi:hypothetical protein
MEEFAQLSDFIIRYISNPELRLNDVVGLSNQDDQYQHPQIVYIPDDLEFCTVYNNGQPKVDCFPTEARLNELRQNSENFLTTLHQLPLPWADG